MVGRNSSAKTDFTMRHEESILCHLALYTTEPLEEGRFLASPFKKLLYTTTTPYKINVL